MTNFFVLSGTIWNCSRTFLVDFIELEKRMGIVSDSDLYVTASQARQIIGVSKQKMTNLLRSGELPYVTTPRHKTAKLIRRVDLDAWLEKAIIVPRIRQKQPMIS
jgi:hypothetical protein